LSLIKGHTELPILLLSPPSAQQRKLRYVECKEENHVTKDCNNYWRWREQEVRRKLRELKEKPAGEERVVRHTMRPLREV